MIQNALALSATFTSLQNALVTETKVNMAIKYYHLFSASNVNPCIPAVTVVVIVIVVVIIVIAIGVTAKIGPSVAGPIPIISRLFLLFFLGVCREFITMEPDSDSVESYSWF